MPSVVTIVWSTTLSLLDHDSYVFEVGLMICLCYLINIMCKPDERKEEAVLELLALMCTQCMERLAESCSSCLVALYILHLTVLYSPLDSNLLDADEY